VKENAGTSGKSASNQVERTPRGGAKGAAATPKAGKSAAAAPAKRGAEGSKETKGGSKKTAGKSVAEAATAGKADRDGYVVVNGRRVRMISTGGIGLTKRPKISAAAAEAEAPEPEKKIRKTVLTAKELSGFRELLVQKRAEIVGDLSAMSEAAFDTGGDNLSKLPVHMADIGSDVYQQDLNLGLAEAEYARLKEIDEALRRIEERTYGMCHLTGEPIPKERLHAKPWAKYSIEAARQFERLGRPT